MVILPILSDLARQPCLETHLLRNVTLPGPRKTAFSAVAPAIWNISTPQIQTGPFLFGLQEVPEDTVMPA